MDQSGSSEHAGRIGGIRYSALSIRSFAHMTRTQTAIVNGHKQSRTDELLPWNYAAKMGSGHHSRTTASEHMTRTVTCLRSFRCASAAAD
jgi:hypothetical protein